LFKQKQYYEAHLIGLEIDGVAYTHYSGGLINRFMQFVGKRPMAVRYYTITHLASGEVEVI
jgi:hypothetical protein